MLEELLKIIDHREIDKERLFKIIPELKACETCECNHPAHCYNILEHSLQAVKKTDDTVLKITLLLHDIGKPDVMKKDYQGITHFKGHEVASVEKANTILERLGIEGEFKEDILTLIYFHDFHLTNPTKENLRKLVDKLGYNIVGTLFKVQRADIEAHAWWFTNEKKHLLDDAEEIFNEMREQRYTRILKGFK